MIAPTSPTRRFTAGLLTGAAALFLIAAAPAEPVSSNRESQDYYEDAQKQLEKSDPRAAVIQLKNALRTDSGNASARHLLGLIYLRSGDGELAEKELKTAIQQGYPEEQALASLAEAYMVQNKYEAVLNDFQPGNRGTALETQILMLRGYAQAALNKPDAALKSFADAATLSPKDARPLAGTARVYLNQNKRTAAEAELKRAIEINPQSAEALSLMGEVHRVNGQADQALDDFDHALAQDAHNRTALTGRAMMRLDRGEADKADPDIKLLTAITPRNPLAAYLQALSLAQHKKLSEALTTLQKQPALADYAPAIYLQSVLQYQGNQVEQAIAGWQRYIEMAPTDVRARKLLANAYLKRNDPERAVKTLAPALDTNPDDVQVLSALGSAYLAQGQNDKATDMLGRAAAIDPNNAQTQTRLAAGQLQAGEPTEALKSLEQALNANPSEVEANLLLVMTYLRDRKFDEARDAARRFEAAQPKSPLPLAALATIASAQGDRATARGYLEKAVALQPDYFTARMNLAQLDIDDGKPTAAIDRYNEILKRDKTNIPAMLAFANLQFRQGKPDDAIDWLERARAADLTAVDPRFNLVEAYLRRNDASKALVIAAELTTIAPQSARATAALANAQFASGDKQSAITTFRHAAALQPNAPQPLQYLARALIQTGDDAGGRTALQQAIALAPDYEPARADLIGLELKAGRRDAALKLAQDWRDAKPNDAAPLALVGDVLMRETRYPEALTTYEALFKEAPSATSAALLASARDRTGAADPAQPLTDYVAAHPDDAQGHELLGQRYLAHKDMAHARAEFEKLSALAPNDAATLNNLAWIYQVDGDPRAATLAQRAFALAPGSPDIGDTFGWILIQNGEIDKGVPILRDAAAKLPDNGEVRYHLAAALLKSGDADNARRMLQTLLASGDKFDSVADARALLETIPGR
jgi:putative PEP-CTERM system TPR-repeat lipoprotein